MSPFVLLLRFFLFVKVATSDDFVNQAVFKSSLRRHEVIPFCISLKDFKRLASEGYDGLQFRFPLLVLERLQVVGES